MRGYSQRYKGSILFSYLLLWGCLAQSKMKKETKIDLKKALERSDMSEAELARRLGWKKQYLNKISCGRNNPTIKKLERIAESLGMTLHISFE